MYKLNPHFTNHAQRSGIVFSREEIEDNMQMSHGGHPNIRSLIDKLHVRNMNSLFKNWEHGDDHVMIDVGSKYMLMKKLLKKKYPGVSPHPQGQFDEPITEENFEEHHHRIQQALAAGVRLAFLVRPDLGPYDTRYYEENQWTPPEDCSVLVILC